MGEMVESSSASLRLSDGRTGQAGLVALAALLLLFAGTASAIGGASISSALSERWSGSASSSITTEGGNITQVNVSSVSLTDRWAAFYGNVSGLIVLGNDTASIFNWSYSPSSGGKVCLSNGGALTFLDLASADAPALNGAFSLGGAADNATNTFSGTCPQMTFSQGLVASPARIAHKGYSNLATCAITSGGVAKNNYAFCSNISANGISYKNDAVNYEIMVPTMPGAAAYETYYFYAELG